MTTRGLSASHWPIEYGWLWPRTKVSSLVTAVGATLHSKVTISFRHRFYPHNEQHECKQNRVIHAINLQVILKAMHLNDAALVCAMVPRTSERVHNCVTQSGFCHSQQPRYCSSARTIRCYLKLSCLKVSYLREHSRPWT